MSFPRQVIPGRTYLVTRRCTQRQFLLRPDDETNNAFVYCLGYAAKETGVEVIAFLASSNHYHAVMIDRRGEIPKFLELFHRLLAGHQNRLHQRSENMWSNEQTSLVELTSPDDIFAKVVYTLANPVKDHLVDKAHHWPGASSLRATIDGRVLRAKRPFGFFRKAGKMPPSLELECVRMPGCEDLTSDEYQSRLRSAIEAAEVAAAGERATTGHRILGRKTVLSQTPHERPKSIKPRSPVKPRVASIDMLL
ncbi:MAG TPA: hypothetical protein VGF45_08515, partial [Polyangia bacterium]